MTRKYFIAARDYPLIFFFVIFPIVILASIIPLIWYWLIMKLPLMPNDLNPNFEAIIISAFFIPYAPVFFITFILAAEIYFNGMLHLLQFHRVFKIPKRRLASYFAASF